MEKKEKFDRSKYNAEFTKRTYNYYVTKVRKDDTEINEWMEKQENVGQYLKRLIREDIERNRK